MTTVSRTDPLAELAGRKRAYVVEPLKLLYISTAKNACTSLKWLVAELAGEDLSRFRSGSVGLVDEVQAIHQRRLFRKTPKLGQIDPEVRRGIRPDNGWFVFSVVRDPRARLFSAWENKFQLHNPAYLDRRDEPWFPAAPKSADDVVANFAQFVDFMDANPQDDVLDDSHFMTQMSLLRMDIVDYSKVYEISELSTTFISDITAHLREQGWDGEVKLRRANDTPLAANGQAITEPVRAKLEKFYADDFAAFGDRWDFAKIANTPDWPTASIQDVNARIAAAERVHDLLGELRRARREARQATQQRDSLKAQVRDLKRGRTRAGQAHHAPGGRNSAGGVRRQLGTLRSRVARLARRLR